MDDVGKRVAELVRRHGTVGVDVVVEAALYGPGGFYEAGGSAGGRGGDFLTSVEVGPLFGAVLARALDGWWEEMGRPDPYVVVDAGAGRGTLCRTVLAARPACAPALRYVLVERSAAQRARHGERLAVEEPALAFAPVDPDTEQPAGGLATGPICVSLAELPRLSGPVVVVANELLDNLPFGLAEYRDGSWHEVRVTLRGTAGPGLGGAGGTGATGGATSGGAGPVASPGAREAGRAGPGGERLVEHLVPLSPERRAVLDRLAPGAAEGARAPLQDAARGWLADALALAGPGGRVLALDYAATTAGMSSRPERDWLRTYRGHARGGHWLHDLGAQDVTCEVAVDQLALVRPPHANRSQADWLHAWGIGELVEEGRRLWSERAHAPDVAALTARSRVTEAAALTAPDGLGAFRALEWHAP